MHGLVSPPAEEEGSCSSPSHSILQLDDTITALQGRLVR